MENETNKNTNAFLRYLINQIFTTKKKIIKYNTEYNIKFNDIK